MVKSYSKKFIETYSDNLNGMVEKRMRKAIETIGCFWYTAWIDAGQPNLLKMNDINTMEEDSLILNPNVLDNNCIH